MDGLAMLYTRRSVRSFSKDVIDNDVISKIVKAGKLAATARNEQPVEIVIIKDKELKQTLAHATDYGKFIAEAPLCLIVFSKQTKYYLEDGSAAAQNILLAARYFGIGSCWVAGDKKVYATKIGELCNMPPDHKLICLIPLGYPEDKTVFKEKPIKNTDNKIL